MTSIEERKVVCFNMDAYGWRGNTVYLLLYWQFPRVIESEFSREAHLYLVHFLSTFIENQYSFRLIVLK